MKTQTTKPTKFAGLRFRAVVTPEGEAYDVMVETERNGAWVPYVTGMFDAGGLQLSDCTPDGAEKLVVAPSLYERLHDQIEDMIAVAALEDEG